MVARLLLFGLTILIGVMLISGAQITSNPIPAPIEKRGLAVEIKDLVRLPDTRGMRPADQDVTPAGWARVSYVRDLPDGRRFANDSRGFLYLLDANNQPQVYANVAAAFPLAVYNRLESGFIGFVFHPEFARNGLFYTVHAERGPGNPKTPDFIPPGFALKDVTYHNIITEWHATNPGGEHVRGHAARAAARGARRREPDASDGRRRIQPDGEARRSPTTACSTPAAAITDSATAADRTRTIRRQTQRLDSIITAILRIDPRSPSVTGGDEGPRRLHDSDGQQVRRGRRSEDARRDLRLRLPQRPPAVVGHRRDDVRLRHRHEQHRGDQHRPQRRELRLDEARRASGRTAGWRGGALNQLFPLPAEILERAREGRLHLSGRDLRPRRRAAPSPAASPITAGSPRCAASSCSATSSAAACSPPTSPR